MSIFETEKKRRAERYEKLISCKNESVCGSVLNK
jgi:hypothetical protein